MSGHAYFIVASIAVLCCGCAVHDLPSRSDPAVETYQALDLSKTQEREVRIRPVRLRPVDGGVWVDMVVYGDPRQVGWIADAYRRDAEMRQSVDRPIEVSSPRTGTVALYPPSWANKQRSGYVVMANEARTISEDGDRLCLLISMGFRTERPVQEGLYEVRAFPRAFGLTKEFPPGTVFECATMTADMGNEY